MTKRLIEQELPLARVNAESAREKSLRHGHISTMHLWWARRPLAMSRAVVAGSLINDPENEGERRELLDLIAEAARFESSNRREVLDPLAAAIRQSHDGRQPRILDCFAGGGAIPLEALRLGCDTTAVDLNPVATLVERCVLDYPQRFGQLDTAGRNPLADDFVRWAKWVRGRAEPRTAKAFASDEHGRRPPTYFWSRTMKCPNGACGVDIPLVSSRRLANSKRRQAWIRFDVDSDPIGIEVEQGDPPPDLDLDAGTIRASSAVCPRCGAAVSAREVRSYAKAHGLGDRLYAVMDVSGRLRTYRAPSSAEVKAAHERAPSLLNEIVDLPDGTSGLPDEPVDPIAYINLQNLVYGYDTWRSLFSDRQLYVIGVLCEGVREAHAAMLDEGMDADRARALSTYLGFLVDKIADYNSRFTSWRTTAEATRGTFPRQAIAMAWDSVETDPFHGDGGIWESHTRWIELAVRHCSAAGSQVADVVRGNAQELPFQDESFDAVIVDPPYYYSVMFSDLSDFFYVWLRRSIGHLHPELFGPQWTPKEQEVIQNRTNPSDPRYISSEDFELRLERSLREIVRVVKTDGVVSIVFAHTDVVAWERLLNALRKVKLVVTTSWPMRSERQGRQLAQVKAALGSSVVLVCRPGQVQGEGFFDDVVRQLEGRIAERLDAFESMGLAGADYFSSAVGPAFEVFARYSRVVRLSGEEVDVSDLMVLARQTVAHHAMRRLMGDEGTLSAVDAPSLFYVTWRWAYGTAALPIDDVYKLERAFDVDVDELAASFGIIERKGSSARLLGPQERRDIHLSASPPLIDVLHVACRLWDAAKRSDLASVLAATGMGDEPAFWACANALAQVLPDGDKERVMLLGLSSNSDKLVEVAGIESRSLESLVLFEDDQLTLELT